MENRDIHAEMGFRSREQWIFPRILNVCVIRGDCPCSCVHCPVGSTEPAERHGRFSKSRMDAGLFRKIIDEAALYPHSSVRIHGVGEPILWDALSESLIYAHSRGVLVWLFTSLVTENRRVLEEIARCCGIIEVSVNSIDPENYSETKGIRAFEMVRKNLASIRSLSLNYGARILASRVESDNKRYDESFVIYWKASGLVDDAFIRSYHSYNSLMPDREEGKPGRLAKCLVHWNRFNIDCDGTVVVCFNELFREGIPASVILGSVRDQSVSEIWHSEKLNAIRRACIDGDAYGLPHDLPCIGCASCQEEGGGRETSDVQIIRLREGCNGRG